MSLPGTVTKISMEDGHECEFNPVRWDEVILRMQEKGTCSDHMVNILNLDLFKTPCKCPAAYSIQGETDSFGAEYDYYCEHHYAVVKEIRQFIKDENKNRTEECPICHSVVLVSDILFFRDYDEGLYGPVYEGCGVCRQNVNHMEDIYPED